ncbi:MAG: hypothetical protein E7200_03295 [Selenomonas ruminantium]|nr:hypothetical protein [Selenomonas ruminantium]
MQECRWLMRHRPIVQIFVQQTGDIDCLYHFALYELMEAVQEYGADDAESLMKTLIEGKRIKDISDLPLDLSV